MSHSSIFCVKCKSQSEAVGRHNVQLLNNRRALKGVCPVCATETYRFMPEEGKRETQLSLISSQHKLPSSKASASKALAKAASLKAPAKVSSSIARAKMPSSRAPARSVLMSNVSKELGAKSRTDYLKYGLAEKLLHYGVLIVIFGLSFVIGCVICSKVFPS